MGLSFLLDLILHTTFMYSLSPTFVVFILFGGFHYHVVDEYLYLYYGKEWSGVESNAAVRNCQKLYNDKVFMLLPNHYLNINGC